MVAKIFSIKKVLPILFFLFAFSYNACAVDMEKVKIHFLSGDYKSAIVEGEKLLAGRNADSPDLDNLYYILGLSYLKDGNFLRASDIFEIILKELNNSSFKEEARLGLGDTYFLRGYFALAEDCYRQLLGDNPNTKLLAQLYYRLSQCGFKKGDMQQAKEYLDRLKQEFPASAELKFDQELCSFSSISSDMYYSVQVGSFLNSVNAKNLIEKLLQNGYTAFIEESVNQSSEKIYRVKVGKFNNRQEALVLENKLSQDGYPTKVCP